ncbi:Enoyl-CoA hydratase/carnithine racemase [Methylobacterium sp. 174MFSha1.1]|uniref:crotonase/enoyl-CoA hydratase family protein n=1 Tax=Methylobacterium sp. 174MFSha1.1 TaxID=1502749 RepID=UPI0008E4BD86|nr:crotonase/enoyl-CoA hydratase family protein [Methylobacterium sp. 174MFSha1.1]SFU48596.1 Enoyl-CoA hydratase/carnithine racemase [Methylobacterium sp. 174MFSha1.1]
MATDASTEVLSDLEDGVLTITLNRPDKLNAFTATMREVMVACLGRADRDDAVRAVIVTGRGRGFCAGADMSAGAARFDVAGRAGADGEALRDSGGRLALRLFESKKPVIAAVNGAAVGVGATMLLPMDIRLAATNARFAFPFTRRGLVPEACSSWFLPRAVGMQRAMEWVATGRMIPAEEALASGLVRSLHAPDDLLPAARALAREIADAAAPVSVALARQMLWRMLGAEHPMEAHRIESRLLAERGRSPDVKEGVTSFFEKRAPDFSGRVSADMPEGYPWWRDRPYGEE